MARLMIVMVAVRVMMVAAADIQTPRACPIDPQDQHVAVVLGVFGLPDVAILHDDVTTAADVACCIPFELVSTNVARLEIGPITVTTGLARARTRRVDTLWSVSSTSSSWRVHEEEDD